MVLGATAALITSLLAVLFLGDIGVMLYLVAVALLTPLFMAVSLGIGILRSRCMKVSALALLAVVSFVAVATIVTLNESRLRPPLYWLVFSQRYKREVLANSVPKGEFKHIEWRGDGWGSAMTGDWTGYVVFDPSDSLSDATVNDVPANYRGIPCTVVQVRRLEKQWYSVVTDMNQFWDNGHPGCGPLIARPFPYYPSVPSTIDNDKSGYHY